MKWVWSVNRFVQKTMALKSIFEWENLGPRIEKLRKMPPHKIFVFWLLEVQKSNFQQIVPPLSLPATVPGHQGGLWPHPDVCFSRYLCHPTKKLLFYAFCATALNYDL